MRTFQRKAVATSLAVLLGISVAIAANVIFEVPSTVVAAWVQAIGSIGAIAAALFIGNRQHYQALSLIEKERERFEKIRNDDLVTKCGIFEREIDGVVKPLRQIVHLNNNVLGNVRNPAIPPHEFPGRADQIFVECETNARTAADTLKDVSEAFNQDPAMRIASLKLVRELDFCANKGAWALGQGLSVYNYADFCSERLLKIRDALSHVDPGVQRRFEVPRRVDAADPAVATPASQH